MMRKAMVRQEFSLFADDRQIRVYRKSPVYSAHLPGRSNKNITEPGQWPAGSAVTVNRSFPSTITSVSSEIQQSINKNQS